MPPAEIHGRVPMACHEPDDGGGEMNGGQEVAFGFVVTGGAGPVLLEFG